MNIPVKIKLTRGARIPEYATKGSAAVDLRAALEGGSVTLAPGCREKIPTGLARSSGREDIVAVIAGRSGLGAMHGITLSNGNADQPLGCSVHRERRRPHSADDVPARHMRGLH